MLASERDALGLTSEDLADSIVLDAYPTRRNGVWHVFFRQRLDGVEVLNGDIGIHLSPAGRTLGLSSAFVPSFVFQG